MREVRSALDLRRGVVHNSGERQGLRIFMGAYLAACKPARSVIKLDDINCAALLRIALHYCWRAVGTKGFDGFWLAVEIIVMDLVHKNSVRILLNEIDLAVEIPIALDLDQFIVSISSNYIRPPGAVTVDGDLVRVLIDPVYPLVGMSVTVAMSDRTGRLAAT
jgi:hypothetical protein